MDRTLFRRSRQSRLRRHENRFGGDGGEMPCGNGLLIRGNGLLIRGNGLLIRGNGLLILSPSHNRTPLNLGRGARNNGIVTLFSISSDPIPQIVLSKLRQVQ